MLRTLNASKKPLIIAGPCVAESKELLFSVAERLSQLAKKLDFELVFKASFDKANRTSVASYRGPGPEQACQWFDQIKEKYACAVTTDVHEVWQVEAVSKTCDVLQIPAFLCRQTDLINAAVQSGRAVTVKKGQFLSPEGCKHIVDKAGQCAEEKSLPLNLALIERGSGFGYNNLVVDMRGLKTMASFGVPVIFDITHSTQQPGSDQTTGGLRHCAPLLARAAAATGYLSGVFLEVHENPREAKSDATTQLSLAQAEALLSQIVPMLRSGEAARKIDAEFF